MKQAQVETPFGTLQTIVFPKVAKEVLEVKTKSILNTPDNNNVREHAFCRDPELLETHCEDTIISLAAGVPHALEILNSIMKMTKEMLSMYMEEDDKLIVGMNHLAVLYYFESQDKRGKKIVQIYRQFGTKRGSTDDKSIVLFFLDILEKEKCIQKRKILDVLRKNSFWGVNLMNYNLGQNGKHADLMIWVDNNCTNILNHLSSYFAFTGNLKDLTIKVKIITLMFAIGSRKSTEITIEVRKILNMPEASLIELLESILVDGSKKSEEFSLLSNTFFPDAKSQCEKECTHELHGK